MSCIRCEPYFGGAQKATRKTAVTRDTPNHGARTTSEMGNMKTFVLIGAMSALATLAQSSMAADNGPYIGAGLGVSVASIKNTSTGVTNIYTASNGRILGGYQFTKNFAAEAEYVNLGQFSDPSVSVDTTTYGVAGVGILPLGSGQTFSLFGKIGLSSTTTKAKAAPGYVLTGPSDQTKTGVSFGAGVNFDVSPNVRLRISLDSYEYGVSDNAISGRMAAWGVNGIFRF